MKKYAIYTAIIGGYDTVRQPSVIDERFDYILFSNSIDIKEIGVWQVRTIPYQNEIPTKMARWAKTHPEELLSDYIASVWMDGRICITSHFFYDRIDELHQSGYPLAHLIHPERDCAYDELFEVMTLQLEEEKKCLLWGQFLVNQKYPPHNGLSETGVLFRDHHDIQVCSFDTTWWHYIDNYSNRDQLSFDYALWKQHLPHTAICKEDVRKSALFDVSTHAPGTIRTIPQPHLSRLLSYALRYPKNQHVVTHCYQSVYKKKNTVLWTFLYGEYLFVKQYFRGIKRKLLK